MLSLTEENYLKSIYHLSEHGNQAVTTNAIADTLDTKPASVSDMIKKLSQKGMIDYIKYRGVTITETGKKEALKIIRKHRLWETFLVEKLKFNWDEVHEVAEQLEHIKSPLLIERLDTFLGKPRFDPHGDPIPDQEGEIEQKPQKLLKECPKDETVMVLGVKENTAEFLQYLDKMGIYLGAKIHVLDKVPFDDSMELRIDRKKEVIVSREVSENIYVTKNG